MKVVEERTSARWCSFTGRWLALLLLLLLVPASGWGQNVITTATLAGMVTDPSALGVPGAQVVATNVGTSVEFKATTNATGEYLLLNLPPGTYNVSAAAQGFKTTVRANILLIVNQSSTLNLPLELGAMTQEVQVTGAPPTLQTGTATVGTLVDAQRVVDLPLNGRNFTTLVLLAPGASPIDEHQDTNPIPGSISPPVNGQFSRSNMFMVDGIIDSDPFFSGFAISPSLDAIQEFDVESHNDKSESGGSLGGQINLVTKAGTDRLHGSLFEFNRNKAVSARNFFQTGVIPAFNQNQFGANAGGPIPIWKLKHNTWFYAAYEGYRFTQGTSSLSRVPTDAEWSGDFSADLGPQTGTDALGRPVYVNEVFNPYTGRSTTAGQLDPTTGLVAVSTGYVRDPFPGNIINPATLPASSPSYTPGQFNPIVAVKAWVPGPNMSLINPSNPLSLNYINTLPSTNTFNQWTGRVDHRFGPNDMMYGTFMFQGDAALSPTTLPLFSVSTPRDFDIVGLHWLHNISSSTVLALKGGFLQAWSSGGFTIQPSNKFQMFQTMGFAVPDGAFILGGGGNPLQVPGIGTSQYFTTGESSGYEDGPARIQQYAADISHIRGSHTIKAGVQFFHVHLFDSGACPSVGFNQINTNDPSNITTTGDSLASLLLGDPYSGGIYNGFSASLTDTNIYGFYGQDSWRATPKLTVNFGLRWDYTTPPSQKHDYAAGFDLATGKYYIAGSTPLANCANNGAAFPCIPDSTLPAGVYMFGHGGTIQWPVTDNWQPRLGFAYRLSDRTAVRLGAGTYFDNWAAVAQGAGGQSLRGNWPFGLVRFPTDVNDPVFTADAQHIVPRQAITTPNPFPVPTTEVANTNNKNAYTTNWNLDIQRQVTSTLTLTGAYVGSKGSRTQTGFMQNTAVNPGSANPSVVAPFAPEVGGLVFGTRDIGSSWYNAFQFKAEQRLAHGLSYLVSYTWSKSEDIGCSGFLGIEGCEIQNPWNLPGDKSPSNFSIPQMLVISYSWKVPFGKGMSFVNKGGPASAILGNWQFNGITSFYSGKPITANEGVDTANTGNFQNERPDQIGDPTAGRNVSALQWLNVNAFQFAPNCAVVPASQCRFGFLGRNTLRDKAPQNWDFSIFRDFPITESLGRIQLRFEFFDLPNHPNLSVGGSQFIALNSGTFGELLSQTNNGRNIQFGAKWIF